MNNANPRNPCWGRTGTGTNAERKDRRRVALHQAHSFLLLVPSDAEPIVALLEQLAATSLVPIPFPSFSDSVRHAARPAEDHWLEHSEAAKCLGVSKSTLYR